MSRRILDKKPADKSAEKKKRDALVHSIAVEQQVHDSLIEKRKETEQEVSRLEKEKQAVIEKVEFYKKNASEYEKLHEQLVAKVGSLQSEVSSIASRVGALIKEELAVRMSLRATQDDATKERTRIAEQAKKDEIEFSKRKFYLEQEVASLEAKIKVLTKSSEEVALDIANKSRERDSLDSSLARRMAELAEINLNLSQSKTQSDRAEKELAEVGARIKALQSEIVAKDAEIAKKEAEVAAREKEVEAKREELLAVMSRSKKVDEKAQAVKTLFERAGLKVDI